MKLHELLASYKGQALTAEMITAISTQVDVIRDTAVLKETDKFKDYENMKTELKTFRDEKTKAEFTEKWTKAGGIKDPKLDDYKLENYKKEDGSLDHNKLFKAHPSLKSKETKPPSSNNVFSAVQSLTGSDQTQAGENKGDDGVVVY